MHLPPSSFFRDEVFKMWNQRPFPWLLNASVTTKHFRLLNNYTWIYGRPGTGPCNFWHASQKLWSQREYLLTLFASFLQCCIKQTLHLNFFHLKCTFINVWIPLKYFWTCLKSKIKRNEMDKFAYPFWDYI